MMYNNVYSYIIYGKIIYFLNFITADLNLFKHINVPRYIHLHILLHLSYQMYIVMITTYTYSLYNLYISIYIPIFVHIVIY